MLSGTKSFCSGVGLCDGALVTAFEPDSQATLLVHVDLRDRGGSVEYSSEDWASPALAATQTGTVVFRRCTLHGEAIVGPPGWYLKRTGFWHGSMDRLRSGRVEQRALVDATEERSPSGPHRQAELGALRRRWPGPWPHNRVAGDEIDVEPDDTDAARRRGLIVRHLIERQVTEIVDRFGRAVGPGPMAFDEARSPIGSKRFSSTSDSATAGRTSNYSARSSPHTTYAADVHHPHVNVNVDGSAVQGDV